MTTGVTTETPAQRLEKLRQSLDWGASMCAAQPHSALNEFQRCARSLAHMLIGRERMRPIDLPDSLVSVTLPSASLLRLKHPLHLGKQHFFAVLRRTDQQEKLLRQLLTLISHADKATSTIARFVAYLTAEILLTDTIPDSAEIENLQAFDLKKRLIVSNETEAEQIVSTLLSHIHTLRLIERLYPGWMSSDLYTDKQATLANAVTIQGRGLVHQQMSQLITDLISAWQHNKIARGLTLLIPFLDERDYRFDTYRLVVVPTSRIPFQPAFVVSACRLAERDIRDNSRFAQATRWQLVSELDRLAQTFEHSSRLTSSSSPILPDR